MFLFVPPTLSLYCSLHTFKYRWTNAIGRYIASAMQATMTFQGKFFELLFRCLTFLVTLNGLIAIPHLVQVWTATAKEIDHATTVLLVSGAGLLIAYKFPTLNQRLWRIHYLNSKGRSQLSKKELAEADSFADRFDTCWDMAKTAIFLNGLVFWDYGLSILGIK